MQRAHAVVVVLVVVIAASAAHAGVCDAPGGLPMGPVPLSLLQGELGAPRRACPRSEVFVGGDGQAIVQPEQFYGNLQGTALVGGSFALGRRVELFGSVEPFLFQQVISSLTATYMGLGHGSAGATVVALESAPFVLSATGRLTLPFAYGLYKNAWPVGVDVGLTGALSPSPFLRAYGEVLGVGTTLLSAGDPFPRAGVVVVGGAELVLWDWVSLAGEAKALALYESDLDEVSASAALRGRIWEGLGVELYGSVPLAGRERTLAAGGARVGWRFE